MILRRCGAILTFMLAGFVHADDFTPAERATIAELRSDIETSCIEQLGNNPPEVPANAPAVALWLAGLATSKDYCACTGGLFEGRVTPELLRNGTEEQAVTLVRNAGADCVVAKLQATFQPFCRVFLDDARAAGGRAVPESDANRFCDCVQSDLDELTAATFEPFVTTTISDYREYQKSGALPDRDSPSLLASMSRCGLGRAGAVQAGTTWR